MKLCVVAHPVTSPVDKRSYPMIAITSMTRWSQKSLVLPFVPEQKVKKMLFSCLSTPGFVVFVFQSSDPLRVGCLTLVCSKLLRVAERKSEKGTSDRMQSGDNSKPFPSSPFLHVFGLSSGFRSCSFCRIHLLQPGTFKSKQQILHWNYGNDSDQSSQSALNVLVFSIFLYILYTTRQQNRITVRDDTTEPDTILF